jgi:hypothetical protein
MNNQDRDTPTNPAPTESLNPPPRSSQLENFDDLFYGEPSDIEQRLLALVPLAVEQKDRSAHAQILSQVALAQAMQKKFELAHSTLDVAGTLLSESDLLATCRVTLERGRVHHQAGESTQALPFFKQSYELAVRGGHTPHTINAAHMIAIVVEDPHSKMEWNQRALALAQESSDPKAQAWISPLYNNLARSQIEARDFEGALISYKACESLAQERNEPLILRGAIWGQALAHRELGQHETAYRLQTGLLQEYQEVEQRKELPEPLFAVARGMVRAELAELELLHQNVDPAAANRARKYALLAYEDLGSNEWFQRLEPERLERLLGIAGGKIL